MRTFAVLLLAATATACASSSELAPEATQSAGQTTGDAPWRPIELGELPPGVPVPVQISAEARFHALDFYVPRATRVGLRTAPAEPRFAAVDTVLYLYKQGPTGWGRYLAKSEDARNTPWSELQGTLEPGTYRALVKGADGAAGVAQVELDCPGCLPTTTCVFGDTFRNIRLEQTVKVEQRRSRSRPTPT